MGQPIRKLRKKRHRMEWRDKEIRHYIRDQEIGRRDF